MQLFLLLDWPPFPDRARLSFLAGVPAHSAFSLSSSSSNNIMDADDETDDVKSAVSAVSGP